MLDWIVYNVINFFFFFGAMVGTKAHFIQYMHLGFEPESLRLGMLLMILFLLYAIRVLPNVVFIFIRCVLIALME